MIRIMKYGEVPNEEIFARFMPTVNVAVAVDAEQSGCVARIV